MGFQNESDQLEGKNPNFCTMSLDLVYTIYSKLMNIFKKHLDLEIKFKYSLTKSSKFSVLFQFINISTRVAGVILQKVRYLCCAELSWFNSQNWKLYSEPRKEQSLSTDLGVSLEHNHTRKQDSLNTD